MGYKRATMTHFNKGPAYGLSAEVKSKVSAAVASSRFLRFQTFCVDARSPRARRGLTVGRTRELKQSFGPLVCLSAPNVPELVPELVPGARELFASCPARRKTRGALL